MMRDSIGEKSRAERNLLGIFGAGALRFGNYSDEGIVESFDHKVKVHVIRAFDFTTLGGNARVF